MNASADPSILQSGERPTSSLNTPDIDVDAYAEDPSFYVHGHPGPPLPAAPGDPAPEKARTHRPRRHSLPGEDDFMLNRKDEEMMDCSDAASVGAPPSEVNSEGGYLTGMRGGFTLRNYEHEINELRRSNLDLKLRIYLMEQDRGLLKVPEEKENVFRVNLDLRVQNETMKNQLNEKTDLLRAAYEAIKSQEAERLRERSELESQISSLRQTIADSRFSQQDDLSSNLDTMQLKRNVLDQSGLGDRSRALLEVAFGPLPTTDETQQERVDELQRLCYERAQEVKTLGEELALAQKQREEMEEKFSKMKKEFQLKIQELQERTAKKEQETVAMTSKMQELMEDKESTVQDITQKLEAKISDLQEMLEQKESLLKTAEENFKKSQMFILGVASANQSQVAENERMEKEIKVRDMALEKMRTEYDILKNKIRKYRAQGQTSDNSQCNNDEGVMGRLISELNATKASKAMLQAEVEHLVAQNTNSPPSLSRQVDAETIRGLESELKVLKADLSCCQARAMQSGANRALEKASMAFTNAAKDYAASMQGTLGDLRQRLVELIDFLQQLLSMEGEGLLDFSVMSTSMRDALHRSLEEGRRLSQSLSQSMMGEDLDETQRSTIALNDVPQFVLPAVEITFGQEDGVRIREYEALVEELRENVNLRIGAQKEAEQLRKELADKKDYELFARPLSRSRSLSRRRVLSNEKNDTDTFKTVRSGDSDVWSQPDKAESRRRVGIKSKIPVKVDDSTQSSLDNLSGSEAAASKFRHYKAQIIQLQARLVSQEEKLSLEASDLQTQLAEARETVTKLKDEKKNLTVQLAGIRDDLEGNITSLQQELGKFVSENRNLSEKVTKMDSVCDDLRSNVESLQGELHTVMSENRKLSEQVYSLTATRHDQDCNIASLQGELHKVVSENRNLAKKVHNLTGMTNELNGNIAPLQKDLENVLSEKKHLSEEVQKLQDEKRAMEEKLKQRSACNKVMFVSKENFEEQELALEHPGMSPRKPLGEIQSGRDCDCQRRIEELERLLKDTKTLYKGAQEKIRLDRERKERMEKAAKKELEKTKKVLSKTRASAVIQE